MGELLIEDMRPHDWEAVRRIYEEGLASGEASFEAEVPAWPAWDEGHHHHSRLVARAAARVVGWAALAPVSYRACYAGVAEVSLYVAAGWRERGVGKRLLMALVESSERHGIWSLYASTFPENEASIRLQMACGFRVVGRRERIAKHRGVWRDTVITERRSRVVGTE
jgi:L-amino acid N-acyltransferase YncA